MSTKKVLYRVETYIVPDVNKFPIPISNDIISDNSKLASRLNQAIQQLNLNETSKDNVQREEEETPTTDCECVQPRCPAKSSESIDVKVVKDATRESEIIIGRKPANDYDDDEYRSEDVHHCDERIKTHEPEFRVFIRGQDALYPARQFRRANSLMSIDEGSEGSEIKSHDICRHGYQNGCTASIPSPEVISEEVFTENWLQKIESLRQRETILRERENRLQNREREMFRREKELRIAERVLKEKLRQLERQLQHQRDIETVQKRLEKTMRLLDCKSLEDFGIARSDERAKIELVKSQLVASQLLINPQEKDQESNRKSNLTRSRSSTLQRQFGSSNVSNSYNSMRYKERSRPSYDDLDSTLSADVGDSSFVRTSELFNPEAYKKPYAFTRSASARLPKHKSQVAFNVEARPNYAIEEDKIFRKLNENICVSQDKETQFQNYGLVDRMPADVQSKVEHNPNNKGKSSHSRKLESNSEVSHRKPDDTPKDKRPTSWSEETDEWLQKKRQAYNSTMKTVKNKENCNSEKNSKASKKDIKNKLFTLFR